MPEGKLVRLPIDCYEQMKAKARAEDREIGATCARLIQLGMESEEQSTEQRAAK